MRLRVLGAAVHDGIDVGIALISTEGLRPIEKRDALDHAVSVGIALISTEGLRPILHLAQKINSTVNGGIEPPEAPRNLDNWRALWQPAATSLRP